MFGVKMERELRLDDLEKYGSIMFILSHVSTAAKEISDDNILDFIYYASDAQNHSFTKENKV